MHADLTHKRHPSQQELMAYAESAMDSTLRPSGAVADHAAVCPVCAAEVAAITASLKLIVAAPLLEPRLKAESALLMRVRKERRKQSALRASAREAWRVTRGLGYAAVVVLVAALAFGTALSGAPNSQNDSAVVLGDARVDEDRTPKPSPKPKQDALATLRSLSNAVELPASAPLSPELRKQRRAVDALGADMAAAQEALTRNPGCERASAVMNATLERQTETLRDLYMRGSL